jgi:hypothetical protein
VGQHAEQQESETRDIQIDGASLPGEAPGHVDQPDGNRRRL